MINKRYIILIALILAGCSDTDKSKYQSAVQSYSLGNWDIALKEFQFVVDHFPTSPLVPSSKSRIEELKLRISLPNATNAINMLFQGETILERGLYSFEQRELIFKRDYDGKKVFISGNVHDAGTFFGKKYITIEVRSGHFIDIYPEGDVDIINYTRGKDVTFVGDWTRLGTGTAVHHMIESAREIN